MEMYKRILVPTDGSDSSEEALKKACRMAKQNDGQITAVYVVSSTHAWALKDAMREEAEKTLDHARKLAGQEDISLATRIEEGYPFEEIVETAKKLHSDLIIMGSHGHTGISKVLLGSVTERVIGMAPCPVLVVKKER